MQATIVVFKPDGSRVDIPLKSGEYVVGRGPKAKLRVPLPNVSRVHCELTVQDDELRVKDLGSANGTFRNNLRLTPGDEVPLTAGDILAVGSCMMTVQIDGQPGEVIKPDLPEALQAARRSSRAAHSVAPSAGSASSAGSSMIDDIGEDTEDLDETISRIGPPSLAGGENDGSSEFDLDLDFDDDQSASNK